jgi:hypothetical protein
MLRITKGIHIFDGNQSVCHMNRNISNSLEL